MGCKSSRPQSPQPSQILPSDRPSNPSHPTGLVTDPTAVDTFSLAHKLMCWDNMFSSKVETAEKNLKEVLGLVAIPVPPEEHEEEVEDLEEHRIRCMAKMAAALDTWVQDYHANLREVRSRLTSVVSQTSIRLPTNPSLQVLDGSNSRAPPFESDEESKEDAL